MGPEIKKQLEELADLALEKEVYESGAGFLERPYSRYRYHAGFMAGASAAYELGVKAAREQLEPLLRERDLLLAEVHLYVGYAAVHGAPGVESWLSKFAARKQVGSR